MEQNYNKVENMQKTDQVIKHATSQQQKKDEKDNSVQKDLIEFKKEKQKENNKLLKKEEEIQKNLVKYDGKSIKKFDENLPDFSIINQNNENKNNFLESSFLDDELIKLTKELKDITKKVAEPEDKASKSEKKNKMEIDSAEEKKDENLKQPNPENDFIPLKDYPKFKNEAQIAEIEKFLEQNMK